MNKGFTLIETMVSLSLLLLAVLFSARVTVFALAQAQNSRMRFRLMETLDYHKNHLFSLSLAAPELATGEHRQQRHEFAVSWRVTDAGGLLKRIDLTAAAAGYSLPLVFYKSGFIQAVKRD